MITLCILLFITVLMVVLAITFAGSFVVIFIDPIIAILIIYWFVRFIKWIKSKKH